MTDAEYSVYTGTKGEVQTKKEKRNKKKRKENQMMKTRQATPEHSLWKSLPGTGRPMDFSVVI